MSRCRLGFGPEARDNGIEAYRPLQAVVLVALVLVALALVVLALVALALVALVLVALAPPLAYIQLRLWQPLPLLVTG